LGVNPPSRKPEIEAPLYHRDHVLGLELATIAEKSYSIYIEALDSNPLKIL
jgi:hypothetical protein